MMAPSKVSRSTMAAQVRGSVNVFVQPPNDSLEAMCTTAVTTRGQKPTVQHHGVVFLLAGPVGRHIGAQETAHAKGLPAWSGDARDFCVEDVVEVVASQCVDLP